MIIIKRIIYIYKNNRIEATPVLGFLVSTVEDQVPPHLYSFARHGQVGSFLRFGQIDELNRNLMQSTVTASQGENM